jgi:pyruvyltransferase
MVQLLGVIWYFLCTVFCWADLPLYYWRMEKEGFYNFGDTLSLKLVERIVGKPIYLWKKVNNEKKLLAIGSIFQFAQNRDVIWGTGIHGKHLNRKDYSFEELDVRAVRGPLTKQFLIDHFGIACPEVYGDPALLTPYFFPEFKRKNPTIDYLIIPHYREAALFPKEFYPNVVYPTDPMEEVIEKILDAKLVISSALHGIIVAEAFGIPARMLRVTEREPMFKYLDYYYGTGRFDFTFATSIEEALALGGEAPFECDLQKLYETFPFDYWPELEPIKLDIPHD